MRSVGLWFFYRLLFLIVHPMLVGEREGGRERDHRTTCWCQFFLSPVGEDPGDQRRTSALAVGSFTSEPSLWDKNYFAFWCISCFFWHTDVCSVLWCPAVKGLLCPSVLTQSYGWSQKKKIPFIFLKDLFVKKVQYIKRCFFIIIINVKYNKVYFKIF